MFLHLFVVSRPYELDSIQYERSRLVMLDAVILKCTRLQSVGDATDLHITVGMLFLCEGTVIKIRISQI